VKKLLITSAALVAVMGVAMAAGEKPPAEHVQWMKHLGAQNGAIRKGVDVEKNANAIVEEMKGVTTFWKGRTSDVAAKANADVIAGAQAVAKAAAASDTAGIAAGSKMIGAGCKGCHDVHREKISDTENLIK
jgi:cytochrome c556